MPLSAPRGSRPERSARTSARELRRGRLRVVRRHCRARSACRTGRRVRGLLTQGSTTCRERAGVVRRRVRCRRWRSSIALVARRSRRALGCQSTRHCRSRTLHSPRQPPGDPATAPGGKPVYPASRNGPVATRREPRRDAWLVLSVRGVARAARERVRGRSHSRCLSRLAAEAPARR